EVGPSRTAESYKRGSLRRQADFVHPRRWQGSKRGFLRSEKGPRPERELAAAALCRGSARADAHAQRAHLTAPLERTSISAGVSQLGQAGRAGRPRATSTRLVSLRRTAPARSSCSRSAPATTTPPAPTDPPRS